MKAVAFKTKTMVLETLKITLKHDTGLFTVKLDFTQRITGTILQVLSSDGCPIGAIIRVKKIGQKSII